MIPSRRSLVLLALCVSVPLRAIHAGNLDPAKPNVVILYFDDLGYGDMGANGATGLKIPADSKYLNPAVPTLTPNLDKFASQGLRFTHGHSSDGVCSPSRYSLVTGHYSWRTSLKKGVLGGYSPTFMDENRFTIGTLFKRHGYTTAMVGKWHIGMTFLDSQGEPINPKKADEPNALEKGFIDFSKPVTNTPAHRGFDYWFGTPSSLDMSPYVWLESDQKTGQVNVLFQGGFVKDDKVDFSQARLAKNSDFVFMAAAKTMHARAGVKDPTFTFEDYLQVQAQKAADLIHGYKEAGKPFMMYIPMPAPHDPHAVQPRFVGSAGFEYGDYVVQSDYYAGQILNALGDPADSESLAANTVVFISSDNGPEVGAFAASLRVNHDANGPWAGIKRDNWEGGTCVPFMVRWPGKVKPGTTDHACWQGDFVATMADVLRYDLKPDEAPDAESFLPVLLGKPMPEKGRPGFIEHSNKGQFALIDRSGEWKLIDGTGGGGNATTWDADNKETLTGGEVRGAPRQLFHLKNDPGERHNLLLEPTPEAAAKEHELYQILNTLRGNAETGSEIIQ